MLTNLLTRYVLISILDIMMCVFISLSTAKNLGGEMPNYYVNVGISWTLVSLLTCFLVFVLAYGVWRYWKAKHAVAWKDYEVSGYICTLYEGTSIQHPKRTTFYLMTYLTRQIVYAATIVYLYEDPVFQLYVLLVTSIAYNAGLAWFRPFTRTYNTVLHYLNEMAFFFVLTMCMTFTDFVEDIPTRMKTASMLSTFMFVILSLNVLICLVAIILS